ncbi:hypothetical protein R6Q59_029689 [Mikania micrantha]
MKPFPNLHSSKSLISNLDPSAAVANTIFNPLITVVSDANRVTVVFLIGWVDKTDNTKTVEQAHVDSERIDYHNKHLQHLQYAIRQVRILRKWRQPDRMYSNEDYSIEMILIDEEGNKIQGHVLKKWFFRFEKYLNESDCLLIKRPSLGINLSKYKFVDNPNKVNFNYQTYASKCNDFVGQEHGFSFSSFQTVKDNLLPENITIDVIGHVAKFFNKDSQSLNEEKNKSRITMQLHDLQFEQLNCF